jgi:hypothetical protein
LDDELENVIKMDYNPQKQNVFSYLGDLRKAVRRLHELGERLPVSGRIELPDSYIRSRLVRAARQVPVYKPVIDALLILPPMEKWANITSDALYHQLEAVCANELSVYAPTQVPTDGLHANAAYVKPTRTNQNKQAKDSPGEGQCFNFAKGKACRQNPCNFSHSSSPEQKNVTSQPNNPPPTPQRSHSNAPAGTPATAPTNKCNKCGGPHPSKSCSVRSACTWCGKIGHLEQMCNSKKSGKPQVFLSQEGGQLWLL